MKFEYVVTEPFADYERGHVIRDEAEIAKVEKDHASRLVRVAAGTVPADPAPTGERPTPAPEPAPEPAADAATAG